MNPDRGILFGPNTWDDIVRALEIAGTHYGNEAGAIRLRMPGPRLRERGVAVPPELIAAAETADHRAARANALAEIFRKHGEAAMIELGENDFNDEEDPDAAEEAVAATIRS